MARPTKTPDTQRTRPLKFWGTEAEELELDQLAASFGMNRSDFMRSRCLGIAPRQPKAAPDRAALITALGNLGFIRSDINQILKDRWAYKFIEPERAERVFAAIDAIAAHLHSDLEHDH